MLEEFAFEFLNKDESTISGIAIGVGFLGFIVSLVVRSRSKSELQRAPYFAFSSLLYVLTSALSFAWLFALQAASLGILWVLIGGVFLSIAVIGYLYGAIALPRSRDAFGQGRYAILGFIPIANLVLVLKASKNAMSLNRIPTIPLFSGGLGVLSGFAMLVVAGGLSAWFETLSDAMIENADPGMNLEFMLRSQSLEATLQTIAAAAQLPIAIDDVTTLALIEADGAHLSRTYVVDVERGFMSAEFRTGLIQGICAHEPFIVLMREGATIKEVYVHLDGSEIGSQVVTRQLCGF